MSFLDGIKSRLSQVPIIPATGLITAGERFDALPKPEYHELPISFLETLRRLASAQTGGMVSGATLGNIDPSAITGQPEPTGFLEKATRTLSEMAGSALPIYGLTAAAPAAVGAGTAALTGAGKAKQAAQVMEMLSKVPGWGKTVGAEMALGAGYGAAEKAGTFAERAKNTLTNAALFPAFGAAFRGAAKLLPKGVDDIVLATEGNIFKKAGISDKTLMGLAESGQLKEFAERARGILREAVKEKEGTNFSVALIKDLLKEYKGHPVEGRGPQSAALSALMEGAPDNALLPNYSKLGSTIAGGIKRVIEGKALAPGEEITSEHVFHSYITDVASTLDKLVPGTGDAIMRAVRTKDLFMGPMADDFQHLFEAVKTKLTPESGSRIGLALHGKIGMETLSPAEQEVAGLSKKILDTYGAELQRSGLKVMRGGKEVPFEMMPNYFPLELSESFKNLLKGKKKDLISKIMADSPDLSLTEATTLAQRLLTNMRKKFGHVEISRTMEIRDIPEDLFKKMFNTDAFDILPRYMERGALRIGEAREFGPKDERFLAELAKVAPEESSRFKLARRLYTENFRGGGYEGTLPEEHTIPSIIRNVEAVLKLTMSGIRQVSQAATVYGRTASTMGPLEALKMMKRTMKGEFIDVSHQINATNRDALAEMFGGNSSVAKKYLKWVGMLLMDRKMREYAVGMGMEHAKRIAARFAKNPTDSFLKREMTNLGLPKAAILKQGGVLTDQQARMGGWMVNKNTNFLGDAAFLPPAFRNDWMRTFLQFKSYSFKQGHEFYNYVMREALEHGNWKPMTAFMEATAVVGLPTVYLYSAITGKEPPKDLTDAAWETMTFGGPGYGMIGELESAKFGKGALASAALGPAGSDISELAYSGARSLQRGELTPLISTVGSKAIRPIPYVGPMLSRKLKDVLAEDMKATTKAKNKAKKEGK